MMNYWKGMMNWPIDRDWHCETCHQELFAIAGLLVGSGLEWGIQNGICRCTQCHTQYNMRPNGDIVTRPVIMLKSEYQEPAKWAWREWEQPISELDDDKWDEAIEAVELRPPT